MYDRRTAFVGDGTRRLYLGEQNGFECTVFVAFWTSGKRCTVLSFLWTVCAQSAAFSASTLLPPDLDVTDRMEIFHKRTHIHYLIGCRSLLMYARTLRQQQQQGHCSGAMLVIQQVACKAGSHMQVAEAW